MFIMRKTRSDAILPSGNFIRRLTAKGHRRLARWWDHNCNSMVRIGDLLM
jgi:hypothetical protein